MTDGDNFDKFGKSYILIESCLYELPHFSAVGTAQKLH